jgi:hypothetical protein
MTVNELVNRLANDHNLIATMEVSRENIIIASDVLRDLRDILQRISAESISVDDDEASA